MEACRHLAATAEHVVALNGCAHAVRIMHKDARFLDVGRRRDGSPGDLPAPADMLVFEVRACLGWGTFPVAAWASMPTSPR